MATIKEEIMSIAEEQGYEGEGGSTIAEAVSALGSVMGGGGGGGGGGDAGMIVTISKGDDGKLSADKTLAEILSYINSGKRDVVVQANLSDFTSQGTSHLNMSLVRWNDFNQYTREVMFAGMCKDSDMVNNANDLYAYTLKINATTYDGSTFTDRLTFIKATVTATFEVMA